MKKFFVFLSLLLIVTINCLSQDFWERVNVPNDSPVTDIAVSPDGEIFAASIGIYKSSDNAETWTGINKLEYQEQIYDLFEMYAYLRSVFVAKDGTVYMNMGDGIAFKSEDKGENWIPLFEGPENIYNIVEDETGRLFALSRYGLFYSNDKGLNWLQVEEILIGENDYIRNCNMAIAPWGDIFVPYKGVFIKKKDSTLFQSYNEGLDSARIRCFAFHNGIVYAGMSEKKGVYSSNDSGLTWSKLNNLPDSLTVNAIEFSETGTFFAGTDSNGVFVSNDNGLTWQENKQIPKNEIYTIKVIDGKIYESVKI